MKYSYIRSKLVDKQLYHHLNLTAWRAKQTEKAKKHQIQSDKAYMNKKGESKTAHL